MRISKRSLILALAPVVAAVSIAWPVQAAPAKAAALAAPFPFREIARHDFVVEHQIVHHHALHQARVQVRLLEACSEPAAHGLMAGGQQRGRVFVLARVGRVGSEQGVDVAGIVGVELALHDSGGRIGFEHGAKRQAWMELAILAQRWTSLG